MPPARAPRRGPGRRRTGGGVHAARRRVQGPGRVEGQRSVCSPSTSRFQPPAAAAAAAAAAGGTSSDMLSALTLLLAELLPRSNACP